MLVGTAASSFNGERKHGNPQTVVVICLFAFQALAVTSLNGKMNLAAGRVGVPPAAAEEVDLSALPPVVKRARRLRAEEDPPIEESTPRPEGECRGICWDIAVSASFTAGVMAVRSLIP